MKYLLFLGLFFIGRPLHAQLRPSLHVPAFSNLGEMEVKLTYYNRPEGHFAFAFSPKWHVNLFYASEFPKKTSHPVFKTPDKVTQIGT